MTTAAPWANPVVSVLLARRSVRDDYADRAVPDDVIAAVLSCGLAAPSSKNATPWRLHAVTDRAILAELAAAVRDAPDQDEYVPHDPRTGRPWPQYVSTVRESADVLGQVPAAIFVENQAVFSGGRAALVSAPPRALAGSIVGYTLEAIGLGTCVENMWIAAEALGLSAAFMGDVLIAEPQIKARLGVGGDLVGVLCIGYSTMPRAPRRGLEIEESDAVRWHPAR